MKQYDGNLAYKDTLVGGELIFDSDNLNIVYNPNTRVVSTVNFKYPSAAVPPAETVSIETITREVNKKVQIFWPETDFLKYTNTSDVTYVDSGRILSYKRFIDQIDSGNGFFVTARSDGQIASISGTFCDESVVKQEVLFSMERAIDIAVRNLKDTDENYDIRNAKITADKRVYMGRLAWYIKIKGIMSSATSRRQYDYFYGVSCITGEIFYRDSISYYTG